ncbi:hypothetical protein G6F46_005974 [Rhizopus delemar]|uniref:Uncharacterized protein n=1 Tax=Rhizopus delemar TaxID=936053 RepID=A0A9P7CIA0_9FUNG|nr:hypothetical protein G6F53_012242 [Rhizopus delemar]KAG1557710.1 hypothetical protein G6F49_005159 [Rhizopus delemar]KAG1560677.1 hypothetical protein G6F50_012281 [Rhizopus delemar]KAG1578549.1 hypothetical protein G6F48_011841 [Rhizopus delemar]KAG1615738.1 hypothetical protein G6F46_005974 [Rhizopus delemar]
MRLSLIFFGLSSVFMIVSSVPLSSIGLEKRKLDSAIQAAADAAGQAEGAAGGGEHIPILFFSFLELR